MLFHVKAKLGRLVLLVKLFNSELLTKPPSLEDCFREANMYVFKYIHINNHIYTFLLKLVVKGVII